MFALWFVLQLRVAFLGGRSSVRTLSEPSPGRRQLFSKEEKKYYSFSFPTSKHISKVLVLKLRLILHPRLLTLLLIGRSIRPIPIPIREEHIRQHRQMTAHLDAIPYQETNRCTVICGCLGGFYDKGAGEVTPAVRRAVHARISECGRTGRVWKRDIQNHSTSH